MKLVYLVDALNYKLAMFFTISLRYYITFEKYYYRALHCSKRNVYLYCLIKERSENKKKAFFALSLVRSLENFKQGGWRQCSAHSVSACTRQAFAVPIHNFTAWEYCLLIHPCKVFPDTRIRWIENKSHAYFVLNLKFILPIGDRGNLIRKRFMGTQRWYYEIQANVPHSHFRIKRYLLKQFM